MKENYMDKSDKKSDYKSTIFLPKTAFGMKANLAQKEPLLLKEWEKINLYQSMKDNRQENENFILHDGPPYANGHLHMGHALNKILKDVVNRSQYSLGKKISYVPGWDCHGLPIEWEIEAKYIKEGKNKDDVDIVEFRKECRNFASKWIGIQKEEFKRLGILGDWQAPYTTMKNAAEAQIYRELAKFLLDGSLYRGFRPVLWSVVEKTALADAEVEYKDHTSNSIYVRFPVIKSASDKAKGADILIWTTTPWTIPGNRAIAYHKDFAYCIHEVEEIEEESFLKVGDRLIFAKERLDSLKLDLKVSKFKHVEAIDLQDIVCHHPFHGSGYDFNIPLLSADFVTIEQGTGCVHIAPGHGQDDFELGQAHNIQIPQTVDEQGHYYKHVPLFADKKVLNQDGTKGNADKSVIEELKNRGKLGSHEVIRHSYPHSWRSKAPLIFRTTNQWFISLDKNGLREKALKAINQTRFVPEASRARLKTMIENRPDWCLSRQRAWGVPIAIFVHRETGEPIRDDSIVDSIANSFEKEGSDAWFNDDPYRFLPENYNKQDYDAVTDILDVWFDSGTTHSYVLENREELEWPSSLYLEGSDQHRGWFQHSLLEACGTRGRAPFNTLFTHGFVVDDKGYKMSKSVGNVISPKDVIQKYGAEIIRLWIVASDYSEDLRLGDDILKHHADVYRRLRNTLRYLIGSLNDYKADVEKVDLDNMPELEKWVLHKVAELDKQVKENYRTFHFHNVYKLIHNFCTNDLSSFYFDIRKDCLYCDDLTSLRRRSARNVMDILFNCLTRWLAPILCFTTEEAWQNRYQNENTSVHLQGFYETKESWINAELGDKWEKIRQARRVITGAIEKKRALGDIGSSLQAHPKVYVSSEWIDVLENVDMAEICISSALTLLEANKSDDLFTLEDVKGVAVQVTTAQGDKCERCWTITPEVGSSSYFPDLCSRCADVVHGMRGAA